MVRPICHCPSCPPPAFSALDICADFSGYGKKR
ncbi:hypothetical protein CABS03_11783 [Colletotrichum abscissum]|uniref:Uncharacterized protein n=2 Tax=Colletotrichum acutatum species complex TaxID=2707335 RepID=A0A9P9X2W0_9PEZI|nr:hypothetical protein CABS02_13468 [Colletotrichum abscissum]KAK0378045.1 hypothetical protein CLIM01_04591 [Colletotrichum limetticola]